MGRYVVDQVVIDTTFTAAGTVTADVFPTQSMDDVTFTIRVSAASATAVVANLKLFGTNKGDAPIFTNGVTPALNATAVISSSEAVTGFADYTNSGGAGIAITTASATALERSYSLNPVTPNPKNLFFQVVYTSGGGASVRFQVYVSGWAISG